MYIDLEKTKNSLKNKYNNSNLNEITEKERQDMHFSKQTS